MHGLGAFDEERAHAVRVPLGREQMLVRDLERIIVSKKAAGTQKDKLVLPVLSNALKAIKDRD